METTVDWTVLHQPSQTLRQHFRELKLVLEIVGRLINKETTRDRRVMRFFRKEAFKLDLFCWFPGGVTGSM